MKNFIRIACVGDSITFGDGAQNPKTESYPAQLSALLSEEFKVKNFGIPGATALRRADRPYLKNLTFHFARYFQPNLIILNLGINDIKPRNWIHKQNFVADYTTLITAFQKLSSRPQIFICYPTPVFFNSFGVDPAIVPTELIPLIDTVIQNNNAILLDLNTPLKVKNELFADGVHPNAQGYTLIAQTVFKGLRPYLSKT